MMKLNIQEFDTILDLMKVAKSDFVCVHNGMIYGYDLRFCTLKVIDSKGKIPQELVLNIHYNTLILFRKLLLPIDEITIHNYNYMESSMNKFISPPAPYTVYQVVSKANEIISSSSYGKEYGNLRGIEYIENFISAKASDGAIGLNIDKFHKMYLPSNLLPINKSDELFLTITDFPNSFLSKFTIVKKKNISIDIFINFRSLLGGFAT